MAPQFWELPGRDYGLEKPKVQPLIWVGGLHRGLCRGLGDCIGDYYGLFKGDTRSLDNNGSHADGITYLHGWLKGHAPKQANVDS